MREERKQTYNVQISRTREWTSTNIRTV